jgi:hypothetical protein
MRAAMPFYQFMVVCVLLGIIVGCVLVMATTVVETVIAVIFGMGAIVWAIMFARMTFRD